MSLQRVGWHSSVDIEIALPMSPLWNKLLEFLSQCRTCAGFLTAYLYLRFTMHFHKTFWRLSVNGQEAALSIRSRNWLRQHTVVTNVDLNLMHWSIFTIALIALENWQQG